MEGKRVSIIDKDGMNLLDVVESADNPGVFGIVALNPDGSEINAGGGGGGQTLFDAIVATSGGDYTTLGAAVAAGKKTIFIKDGTYNETGNVSLTSGSYVIVGQSRDGVKLLFPSLSDGLRLYSNNNIVKDFTVDTFTNGGAAALIIGDGSTPGTPDTSKGNFNIVDGIRMRGPDTYGKFTMYLAGASYSTGGAVPYWDARDLQEGNIIKNCIIEGHQAGDVAVFALQKNSQFIDNTVIGGRIADYMNYDCIVDRNIIKDSHADGIFIAGPNVGGSTSYNVIINPTDSGIKTENQLENPASYPTYYIGKKIKGNTVINSGYTGFNLKNCDRCDIDAYVDVAGNHGLYIQDSKYNNIDSVNIKNPNEASNARGSGVYLYSASNNNFNNVLIEDNRVTPKMYLGFGDRENTDCGNNNVTNLIVKGGNNQRTVWLQSKGTKISNLYAEGGKYAGILMDGATYSQFGNIYLKNNCQDANNSYAEIWFQNSASNNQITTLITESTLTNKARDGIIFASGCNNNIVLEQKDIGSVNAPYEDAGTGNKVGIVSGGGTWGSITGTLSSQTDLWSALGSKVSKTGDTMTGELQIVDSSGDRSLDVNPTGTRSPSVSAMRIYDQQNNSGDPDFGGSFVIQGANSTGQVNDQMFLYNYASAPQIGLRLQHNNTTKPAIEVEKSNSGDVAINLKKGTLKFQDSSIISKNNTDVTLSSGLDNETSSTKAIKTYVDGLVLGELNYRGGYDASGNVYPTTGGRGVAGAPIKGDMWVISVAGTLGGVAIQIGDSIIANIDSPGQTSANWNTLNSNVSYVPEDVANKKTTMTGNESSNTFYLTAKAIYDWAIGLFMQKSVYDAANIAQQVVGTTATQSLTNKTLNDLTNYIDADALHEKVFLNLGSASTVGMPVQADTYNAGNGAISVSKGASTNANPCLGLLEFAVADGSVTSVRNAGLLTGANTSAWSEGALLYVDSAGTLTATIPTSGYIKPVGVVVRQHATLGVIEVNIGPVTNIATRVIKDANSNISVNNVVEGYTTTVTSASPVTLTVGSTYQQYFTGSTAQTIVMPVTSTLTLGHTFYIDNNSSGVVTINSSGGNLIATLSSGICAVLTCINTGVTDATGWDFDAKLNYVTPGIAGNVLTSDGTNWISQAPTGGGGGDGGFAFKYTFDTSTSNSPASGHVGFDNATPSSVTQIFLNETDASSTTIDFWIDNIDVGDIIMISNATKSKWETYTMTGTFISGGSVDTLPVTYSSGTANFSNGEIVYISKSSVGYQNTIGRTMAISNGYFIN